MRAPVDGEANSQNNDGLDDAARAEPEARPRGEEAARREGKAAAEVSAEVERKAAEATAARNAMNRAAGDAGKVADDLRNLVEEARIVEAMAQPTDARLLLDALESIQKTNPAILGDKRAARILADLVALADSLSRARQPESVYRQARLAVWAVTAGYLDLAEAIVKSLHLEVSSHAPAYLVLKGAVVSFFIVTALGALAFGLYLWTSTSAASGLVRLEEAALTAWDGLSTNIVVVSATFGLLGSLVSVLLRLSDFDGSRRSRQFLTFTGGVLPVVGAIFATVVCAIFASEIVGTSLVPDPTQGTTTSIYFYMVAGFVAGFSERFARGLVGYFETRTTPRDDDGAQPAG